jgi:hypothetical protein
LAKRLILLGSERTVGASEVNKEIKVEIAIDTCNFLAINQTIIGTESDFR